MQNLSFHSEFLLSTLIASNDPLITENGEVNSECYAGFKIVSIKIEMPMNILFNYLEKPLDNFDVFKEIIDKM